MFKYLTEEFDPRTLVDIRLLPKILTFSTFRVTFS